jgi:hypothetical protein
MSNVVKVGMTRPIVILMFAMVLSVVASCGSDPKGSPVADTQEVGWIEAPVIDSATRDTVGLRVSGLATPGSRIVIKGDLGTAFAVGTGNDGRFDLVLPLPKTDTLFVVEVQSGEDAVPAVARLLVSGEPAGPVALISPGSPTIRLDPGTGLDVVDSDRRSRIASGRAAAGRRVAITVDSGEVMTVTANGAGRWTLNLGPIRSPSSTIIVDGVTYAFPGEPGREAPIDRLMPAGRGTILRWRLSDTAEQSSWFVTNGSQGPDDDLGDDRTGMVARPAPSRGTGIDRNPA